MPENKKKAILSFRKDGRNADAEKIRDFFHRIKVPEAVVDPPVYRSDIGAECIGEFLLCPVSGFRNQSFQVCPGQKAETFLFSFHMLSPFAWGIAVRRRVPTERSAVYRRNKPSVAPNVRQSSTFIFMIA